MRTGIVVEVTAADRARLEALIADRNSPQKHVWRARIVLLTVDGRGTAEIMRRTGKAKTAVWRWQERFMQEGFDGVRAWLDRHPRFTFHFVPTSCSWLNAVEGFFAKLSRRRLNRGVFRSVYELQIAINRFVEETNQRPKPFTWTANPDPIIAAVRRGHQTLDSVH